MKFSLMNVGFHLILSLIFLSNCHAKRVFLTSDAIKNHSSVEHFENEESIEDEVIFCLLFLAIFLGAVASYTISRYAPNLPYTVVLFIIGIFIALIFSNRHTDDSLSHSVHIWKRINPHLILFIFLPALLFGDAMSLNYHHVKGAIASSLILAGPGALFGTFAMAGLVKICLPYKWSWNLCLIFGSILSATDPVGE
jgi:NhaP-type Na+/H+ or K+/H+ antiporter